MKDQDYKQIEYESLLRKCLEYPVTKPDSGVEMNYKDFLKKIEDSTKEYPKNISGNIEYYFSAIRYLAYQDWLEYLGYVDDKEWFDIINKNIEALENTSQLLFLSEMILGLTDYTYNRLEENDEDDVYICHNDKRFENISSRTLVNILATILSNKMNSEIGTIRLYIQMIE